jgi:hypothetical protein
VSANTAKSQQAAVKRQIARSEDIKVRLGWPNLGKPFDRTVQRERIVYAKNAKPRRIPPALPAGVHNFW